MLPWLEKTREHHDEQSTRLEDAMALGQRAFEVPDMFQDVERQQRVKALVVERHVFADADVELRRHVAAFSELPGGLDLDVEDVESGHVGEFVSLEPSNAATAGKATEVQYRFALE